MLGIAFALLVQLPAATQPPQSDSVIAGRGGPAVVLPRIESDVVVDGLLDEPAWQQAARLGAFSQYEPIDGRPAEERTDVLVWYSPTAIHFGIIAHDRQPGAIRATQADRDNIDDDDHVLLYLDTFDDRRRAYFFGVNPLGVQQDGVRAEGAGSAGRAFGGNIDKNPDFIYDSRGRRTDEGYVVEVRIPFKSLRYTSADEQRWGFNVIRRIQRTGYTDSWTDVRRASASFLAQAGALTGMRELRRGVVIEAQPFLTATANGARDPVTGFERESPAAEIGLNARMGFTNLTVDATVNPDFSQVESDEGQVTVNERFALFFPEKRPFFLEGIELFATPSQLVYTRRIVDPVGGGKLTGKFGSIGVAHLTMVDQDVDPEGREALFNVTRLRHDFGSNSIAGFTLTDRSLLDGEAFNRVAAADVRYVFGGMYYAEAQVGASWTRLASGTTLRDPIWKFDLDRTGRSWGFHYSLNGVGDEFRTAAGFVNRPGVVEARGFNRLTFYGAPGALLETVQTFFGPNRLWRYGKFGNAGALEGGESASFDFRLRGGWQISTEIARNFVGLDAADYGFLRVPVSGGFGPYSPLDDVSGFSYQLRGNTPTFRQFDANASVQRGRGAIFAEGSEGDAWELNGGFALRPSAWARINFSTSFERITRTRDGSEFARAIIPRLRAELQPRPAVMLRVVGEYRAERVDALRDARTGAALFDSNGARFDASDQGTFQLDLLAAYEPSPGTVVYLGYGSTLEDEESSAFQRLDRVRDGFFLKLAYQFRR